MAEERKLRRPPEVRFPEQASFSSSCSAGEEELLKGDKWTRNSSFGVEEELRIGRLEHHPWLFQALSLNMT